MEPMNMTACNECESTNGHECWCSLCESKLPKRSSTTQYVTKLDGVAVDAFSFNSANSAISAERYALKRIVAARAAGRISRDAAEMTVEVAS